MESEDVTGFPASQRVGLKTILTLTLVTSSDTAGRLQVLQLCGGQPARVRGVQRVEDPQQGLGRHASDSARLEGGRARRYEVGTEVGGGGGGAKCGR